MNWQLPFNINPVEVPLTHSDKILVMGSCFAQHMGSQLSDCKFNVAVNPTGVLFDPLSIARHVDHAMSGQSVTDEHLVYHNELWHSVDHHGSFSGKAQQRVIQNIEHSYTKLAESLRAAELLVITLGTSTVYCQRATARYVANCHQLPADTFRKHGCTTAEVLAALQNTVEHFLAVRPNGRVLLTVSPVRYVREGLVESNRSKARLIEAVHVLEEEFPAVHYFPAYELVVDVLRDYRFYESDMVHPNAQAVRFVWEQFEQAWIHRDSIALNRELERFHRSLNHRPLHPDTEMHRQFVTRLRQDYSSLKAGLPHADWSKEERFFDDT